MRIQHLRPIRWGTCLALIGLIAVTNGNLAAASPQSQDNSLVHVAMGTVTSLDPVGLPRADGSSADSARDLTENLFVGLTRYNPLTNKVEPALAHDWQVSADGLTWTFHLRTDVQWVKYDTTQNQVAAVRSVVAGDFVYALRRACDAQPPRPATNAVYIVAGCRTIAEADPKIVNDLFIAQTLQIQVVNPQTLQITLAFPAVYFPALLTLPEFRPVPREAIAKDPDWTQASVILTDGPFALKSWNRGQQAELIRNPLWPDKADGNVTDVIATFNAPPAADGVARLAHSANAPQGTTIQTAPQTVVALGFSAERIITQPDSTRRALALAIDRNALLKALPDAADWLPASRFTPTGIADNSGYAPDAAKNALAASPIQGCNKLPEKFDFVTDGSADQTIIAQTLLAQWKTVLGCNTTVFTVHSVSPDVQLAIARAAVNADFQIDPSAAPRPHLWIASWQADYPDPNAWAADGLHCQYGYLRPVVPCGAADTLLDQAGTEGDAGKRLAEYSQAETNWFGQTGTFPVAPLYVTLAVRVHPVWLSGVADHGAFRFDQWTSTAH